MDELSIYKELVNLNPWWQTGAILQNVISRPYYLDILLDQKKRTIEIITGARRVGKTFLLKDIVRSLIKNGINPKHILYITGELPSLQKINLVDIYNSFRASSKVNFRIYLFLDEVQEIQNWQQQVKYLYDTYNSKFFLTGSSGLVLNKQTSKLTGRFIETHVMPLSFTEFKSFRKDKSSIEQYLNSGGYPEYVLTENESILVQTVESIMYRDLLSAYGIRNPAILKDLLQLLCDKIGTPVSYNTIAKDLKMDPETVQFYIKYLQDVYLVYPLYRQGKSHKIVKGFLPKYYLNDTGILRLFSKTPREGHLFENAVFLHMYRKNLIIRKELSYSYIEGQEVDFIWDEKMYDSKSKSIENDLSSDITYIVKAKNTLLGYKQAELSGFLLS